MSSLHAQFVETFPDSTTRQDLLNQMVKVVNDLEREGIEGNIWLDGSFITGKPNPTDIDFILVVHSSVYDEGTEAQQKAIDALLEEHPNCDTNVMFLYPMELSDNKNQVEYWKDRFGFSTVLRTPKGIIQIELKGGGDGSDGTDAASSNKDTAR